MIKNLVLALTICLLLSACTINQAETYSDTGKLYPTKVKEIILANQTQILIETVKEAYEKNLSLSISAKQHSQGGHTYYNDSVVLNMLPYNQILNLDLKNNLVTVQSGASWKTVQEHINPYNLSIKVMQSSNIFSIGGSLSSNVHGRDLRFPPISETVQSFRLLVPNGTVYNITREEYPILFSHTIGGYGLFGVILDVTLELTPNVAYIKKTSKSEIQNYTKELEETLKNPNIHLHYGRVSIAKDKSFLNEMYIVNFEVTNESADEIFELKKEKNIERDKFFFGLSRKYDWGKTLRWKLQQKIEDSVDKEVHISRNNAMSPPISFLEYDSEKDTDILQEYFIPITNFESFMSKFQTIMKNNDVNLLSVTTRHVLPSNETFLSYSKKESIAIVLYANIKLSKGEIQKSRIWTQELVDAALSEEGTYYLTYQLFPSQEQIRIAYPKIDAFFETKKKLDEKDLLQNMFYQTYSLG